MKAFIREEINVDFPVDLNKLKAFDKLYTAIVSRIHSSDSYRRRIIEYEETKRKEEATKDMLVRDLINASVQQEIFNNKSLSKFQDRCIEITFAISAEYVPSMERLISNNSFPTYIIQRVKEDEDLRKCMKDLPALYRVKPVTI